MLKVWMDPQEKVAITNRLENDDIVLEWGSGGSTYEFSRLVKEYYSIEHDDKWSDKVKEATKDLNNVYYYHVPENAPRSEPTKKEEYLDYIKYVHTIVDAHKIKAFDKVLIDGRARQWCAIEVLPYLHEDSLVFIHDWVRPRYHEVLKYYNLVFESGGPMKTGVLKKK